jgi:Leucine-rich repeat (LRR) protein
MKKIVANLLLLLVCNIVSSQSLYKTYHWEIAKNLGPDTVYSISFEKEKLPSLPPELFKFVHLKILNLSKNKISELPDEFILLQELEILDLGKNELRLFPTEICRLVQLKKLILNRNSLAYLPDCIAALTQLEHLDIWDTPVETFPEGLVQMKALKYIDARGITHGAKFQFDWKQKLPWIKIDFDAPCNCFE